MFLKLIYLPSQTSLSLSLSLVRSLAALIPGVEGKEEATFDPGPHQDTSLQNVRLQWGRTVALCVLE